jgi:preprotein translocase subunit SecG
MKFFAHRGLKGTMISMSLALTVIQVILSLALVAIVMLQSGKSAGLSGAIAGGADTFLSKNKAKSVDAKLAKATKWVAILWVVLTLVLCVVQ